MLFPSLGSTQFPFTLCSEMEVQVESIIFLVLIQIPRTSFLFLNVLIQMLGNNYLCTSLHQMTSTECRQPSKASPCVPCPCLQSALLCSGKQWKSFGQARISCVSGSQLCLCLQPKRGEEAIAQHMETQGREVKSITCFIWHKAAFLLSFATQENRNNNNNNNKPFCKREIWFSPLTAPENRQSIIKQAQKRTALACDTISSLI